MVDLLTLYVQLFGVFFVIGLFTFGGGYAMLSLIQSQIVSVHGWLTESQFTDIVAVSQMTPGPIGINSATFVGYKVVCESGAGSFAGVIGSLTATLAIILPSFIIILALAKFYTKVKGNPFFEGTMKWIRPSVVGMIAAAALVLMFKVTLVGGPGFSVVTDNFPDIKSWILFVAAGAASLGFKVGPITIIIAGALLGLLLY